MKCERRVASEQKSVRSPGNGTHQASAMTPVGPVWGLIKIETVLEEPSAPMMSINPSSFKSATNTWRHPLQLVVTVCSAPKEPAPSPLNQTMRLLSCWLATTSMCPSLSRSALTTELAPLADELITCAT